MRLRHKCFASTHFIAIRAKQYPFFREMGLGLNLSPSDEGSDRPGSPNTRCPRPCLRPLFSARTNRRLILASCCCYRSGGCPTLLSDRVGRVTVARILDFGVISQRPAHCRPCIPARAAWKRMLSRVEMSVPRIMDSEPLFSLPRFTAVLSADGVTPSSALIRWLVSAERRLDNSRNCPLVSKARFGAVGQSKSLCRPDMAQRAWPPTIAFRHRAAFRRAPFASTAEPKSLDARRGRGCFQSGIGFVICEPSSRRAGYSPVAQR